MPTTRRSRLVASPPEQVWDVVADPYHLPRWWPRLSNLGGAVHDRAHHPWRDTLFSERGTLIAVVVISTLLVIVLRWR